ncbi:hypothetical protein OESDEN_03429 [Oesophagostomum dentatum]|uniref:Uncharacterized protein n=1 Tax=Oesophagostomum dentatum TaxID=61180 RepID=A0A0B1TMK1_OESDE|nr:hypothetical protein OESDEN_03429 [Oesophagostomum dentatum]
MSFFIPLRRLYIRSSLAFYMRSFAPSEYVDAEYLLALTHKVKDDVKDEISARVEQIRRLHSNFRLRLYRPLTTLPISLVPLTFGKQSLHNEPIYEGEEENASQPLTPFSSSPPPLTYTNIPSRATTSTVTASVAAPSTDVFDLIGLGMTPSTSASNDAVKYGITKEQAQLPQSHWPTSSTSTPTAALQSPTAMPNGGTLSLSNQININTNWATAATPTSSQPSSKSKADEWLEDAFRTSLSINSPPLTMSPVVDASGTGSGSVHQWQGTSNNSAISSPVTSGPPPIQPPPPLPTKEVVVNGSLSSRSGTALDAFGQSVTWDPVPAAPVLKAEDPFDIQWSRLASAPGVTSNPFITEIPRELRI